MLPFFVKSVFEKIFKFFVLFAFLITLYGEEV